jgi:hypothetical protein
MGKLEEVPFEWTPPPNGRKPVWGWFFDFKLFGGLKMPWFWVLGKEYCNQRTATWLHDIISGVFFLSGYLTFFKKLRIHGYLSIPGI